MTTKKHSLIALALLSICSVVVANSYWDHDRKVVEVDSRATNINDFVDVGAPGPSPGDIYVFKENLFATGSTRQVGEAVGRCNLIDPTIGSFECTTLSNIGGNIITTNGILYNVPGVVSNGAITGGTGKYRGARGEATVDLGPPEGPHHVRFILLK